MVKYLILATLLCVYIHADVFDDKVRNLMGEHNYQLNENFINRIFANKTMYYTNGRLHIAKIIYALKSNGLLESRFGQPSEVKLNFSARTSPVLLTKITNGILTTMGYSYFVISKAEFSQGLSSVEFSFNTEHSPDIGIIIDELEKRGFTCLDINRLNARHWEYVLEINEPRLANTKFLSKRAVLDLREVSGEYWLTLNASGELQVHMSNFARWNPRVVLYDKNLRIVDMASNTGSNSTFKMKVPQGVKFVMITDYDNQENLKTGISVTLK